MYKHILVPTDGSPLSLDAVTHAITFAGETGARITFFCAVQPLPTVYCGMGSVFDSQLPAKFKEIMRGGAQEALAAAEKRAREAGVECTTLALISEEPYEAIIEAANRNHCDLIFMASHGRRGINALLIGSETQKVLTHSKIPVLVHR